MLKLMLVLLKPIPHFKDFSNPILLLCKYPKARITQENRDIKEKKGMLNTHSSRLIARKLATRGRLPGTE